MFISPIKVLDILNIGELEQKLQQIPSRHPTDGHLSSNFRKKNKPNSFQKFLLASAKPIGFFSSVKKTIVEILINKSILPNLKEQKKLHEKDQIQFHKGVDIAAPMEQMYIAPHKEK